MSKRRADRQIYNVSPVTFKTLLSDDKIARLDKAGILYQVLGDFTDLDLHPDIVSNDAMATSSRSCSGSSAR